MLNMLAQFLYLQVLDLLTTLVFLAVGIREANPVIRLLVSGAGSPLGGLLAAKAASAAGARELLLRRSGAVEPGGHPEQSRYCRLTKRLPAMRNRNGKSRA